MNYKTKIQEAVNAIKGHIEEVVEPIEWMSNEEPDKINAIFLVAAVNDDEGNGVMYEGAALGDTPSLVSAFVNALEHTPQLEEVLITALHMWKNTPCDCPNCKAERALQNMFNQTKN